MTRRWPKTVLALVGALSTTACDFTNAYQQCVDAGRCPGLAADAGSPDAGLADAGPLFLASLWPSDGQLSPAFDAGTSSYSLSLPSGVASVSLTPTLSRPGGSLEIQGLEVPSGQTSPQLPVGIAPQALTTVVKEGATVRGTYTVTATRSAAVLKASSPAAGDWFGEALALSADGLTLAVGARLEASGVVGDPSDNSAPSAGAVYTFVRADAGWAQTGYVKASAPDGGDWFGDSVALSADGTTLAVGAPYEDSAASGVNGNPHDNSLAYSGAAYVFTYDGTAWKQQAYLKAAEPDVNACFGIDVALSDDGSRLAVGSYLESTTAVGSGGVFIFARSDAGWKQEKLLKADLPGSDDHLGFSVGISGDGTRVVAGADHEASGASGVDGDQTDDSMASAGAAYVFARSGVTWHQEAYLKASRPRAGTQFATAVAISKDGATVAAGTPREDSTAAGLEGDGGTRESGAVEVFVRSGATWAPQAFLKAAHAEADDWFGRFVSLSGDGSSLAVAAEYECSSASGVNGDQTDNRATRAGAAYLFTRSGSAWTQRAYLKGPWEPDSDDNIGSSIAISADGGRLAIGVMQEDACGGGLLEAEGGNGCLGAGAVYVY
jgi:hypothetical protein